MMLTTRRARTMRSAIVSALNPWLSYTGGPGTVGLYWRTYNRVRDEQNRRRDARLLAEQGRRHFKRHIVYVPQCGSDGPAND